MQTLPVNAASSAPSPRGLYETPVLRCLGDLRDMTLGGSLGTGDSGNPDFEFAG